MTSALSKLKEAYFQRPVRRTESSGRSNVDLLLRFMATFVAAIVSFAMLNSGTTKQQEAVHSRTEFAPSNQSTRTHEGNGIMETDKSGAQSAHSAGKTLDITFFATVRAFDIAINAIYERYSARRIRKSRNSDSLMETLAVPFVFALSSSIIMWAWFYDAKSLPKSYNKWISNAAQVDPRLIQALREIRSGNFVYGEDTGMAGLLEPMCHEFGYSKLWADPARTIPIPCELYHSGAGPNCEWHALSRFARAWLFAMQMYLPLNMLMLVRQQRDRRELGRAFVDASQSSAFLGLFVSLFYYGVCCARSRLGPRLFGHDRVTPTMWDGGLATGIGCLMCGWSILIEKPARRREIALFVAPRALATFFPRRYNSKV